jgi:hypothetical protein
MAKMQVYVIYLNYRSTKEKFFGGMVVIVTVVGGFLYRVVVGTLKRWAADKLSCFCQIKHLNQY